MFKMNHYKKKFKCMKYKWIEQMTESKIKWKEFPISCVKKATRNRIANVII